MSLRGDWRWVLIGVAANAILAASDLRAATIIVPDDDPSLMHAVENAAAGDVIQVRPGVYTEAKPIVIRESGVQVVGLGGRPVLTGGNGRGGFWVRGASDVSILGFEVRGKRKAVRLDDCTNCGVFDVVVTECGEGVRVRGGSGNSVTGNIFDAVWRLDAVSFDSSPSGFVQGNTMTNPRGRGIRLYRSENSTVWANSVQGGSIGIDIHRSAGSFVVGNATSASRNDGFRIRYSDFVQMVGNDASGSQSDGLYISYSNGVVLDGNSASASTHSGFALSRSDQAVVSGNTASANGGDGFDVSSEDAVVIGNIAASNGGDGFDVAAIPLDIQQNGATDNERYGFYVNSNLTVADLMAAANTASGNHLGDFRAF